MQPITRRRFLVGAGSAGALAVGGAGTLAAAKPHAVHRFLHARGLLRGPDERIPDEQADVAYGTIESQAVRGTAGYGLSLPKEQPSAVLICLHGRGGSHRDPFEDLGVHRFAAAANLPFAIAS